MKFIRILTAFAILPIGLVGCDVPGHDSVDLIYDRENNLKTTMSVGEDCIIYCKDIERGSVYFTLGGTLLPKCGNVLKCEKEYGVGYKEITRDDYIRIKGEKPTFRTKY